MLHHVTFDGACHCGSVTFRYSTQPDYLTDCNCSLCRRVYPLWAHGLRSEIELHAESGATIDYVQGDKTMAMHSCSTCGCTTHWTPIDGGEDSKMAVNFRLCDPEAIADIRIRRFDGADTWKFLD